MPLREEMESQGRWFFRWRSWLPLLALPLLFLAFLEFKYPEGRHELDQYWELGCLGISALGLIIRILVAGSTPRGTSGRTAEKGQIADALNTGGMYSLCRHPLYLANFLLALGPVLFLRQVDFAVLYLFIFWLYYERIILAEEGFLREKYGPAYLEWASRTPAFIPRPWLWRRADLSFSPTTVLKREYQTVFLVVLVFTFFEVASEAVVERRLALQLEPLWAGLLLGSGLLFAAGRILKKTGRLRVAGR